MKLCLFVVSKGSQISGTSISLTSVVTSIVDFLNSEGTTCELITILTHCDLEKEPAGRDHDPNLSSRVSQLNLKWDEVTDLQK